MSEVKKASPIPIFVYMMYDVNDNVILFLQFDSIFGARKGCRSLLKILKMKGVSVTIVRAKDEPYKGCFEVEILFHEGQTTQEILRAMEPPGSNRGVTKINRRKNAR